jgi:hypothetical protein
MTNSDKLKAILNLACVVMSRHSTPAVRKEAEDLLLELKAPSDSMIKPDWLCDARTACRDWREL